MGIVTEREVRKYSNGLLKNYEIHINPSVKHNPRIGFINTIYAGGKTNKGLVKNFLKYCKHDDVDAIVITGNLLYIDMMRYSKYAPDRSRKSQIRIDPEKINYPETIKKTISNPEKIINSKDRKPLFITFKEKFDMVIDYIEHVFKGETEKELFDKDIYLIFGDMEDDLLRQHINEKVRSATVKEKELTKSLINDLNREKREVEKYLLKATKLTEITSFNKQILPLLEYTFSITKDKKKKRKLKNKIRKRKNAIEENENKLEEIKKYFDKKGKLYNLDGNPENIIRYIENATNECHQYLSRVMMTNTDDDFKNLLANEMKEYISKKLESILPNLKVIPSGESVINIGDYKLNVIYDTRKSTDEPSSTMINNLIKRVQDELSSGISYDVVVQGGLSPTYTMHPITFDTEDGQKETLLIQLPTCLDEEELREMRKRENRSVTKMDKLAKKSDFSSGAIIVEFVNEIPKRKILLSEFLTNENIFSREDLDEKIMYELDYADTHIGSKFPYVIETEDDVKYSFEVLQSFLKNAPILRVNDLGDLIEYKNRDTENERETTWKEGKTDLPLTPYQFREKADEILNEKISDKEKAIKLKKLGAMALYKHGIIVPQDQGIEFRDIMDIDFFKSVVERGKKAGLVGPSIVIIGGNHGEKTPKGNDSGMSFLPKEIARELKQHGIPEERIRAPIYGKIGVYAGLFGIKEKTYSEYNKHKQGTSKTKDDVKTMRDKFRNRGAFSAIVTKKFTINRAGHSHHGGESLGRNVFHQKCYCLGQTNTPYGEANDYPRTVNGAKILGLPVGGPETGPLISIDIFPKTLEKYAKEGDEFIKKIDFNRLFENSVV
ncbi:MAG: hypothetical protein DRP08_00520 [Candidatus Aenigmatarchaeota archaeon]|nr:MAG: hypothetical protein DRP08_00520 [Candidatus Aenigmarchaeota archaeon]